MGAKFLSGGRRILITWIKFIRSVTCATRDTWKGVSAARLSRRPSKDP